MEYVKVGLGEDAGGNTVAFQQEGELKPAQCVLWWFMPSP